jgi:hypothetical protein
VSSADAGEAPFSGGMWIPLVRGTDEEARRARLVVAEQAVRLAPADPVGACRTVLDALGLLPEPLEEVAS